MHMESFCEIKQRLFRSPCSSAVTLPSRLVSWDRFKGLKRQGRKDGVNIDSCLSSPEAIFSDKLGAVCFGPLKWNIPIVLGSKTETENL